jgi:hypothetical protein
VHLAANPIPLGLWVTGQEVPQKLVRLGNSLAVSLLGFFEHLLGLAKPMDSISMCSNTVYMSNMDMGSSLR